LINVSTRGITIAPHSLRNSYPSFIQIRTLTSSVYTMKDRLNRLLEFLTPPKPDYVFEFETQVKRFVSKITPGIKNEVLFETGNGKMLVYHYGPEIRITPGLPARDESTGKEGVFVQYISGDEAYQLEGAVDTANQFTFKKLSKYRSGAGYGRISMKKHQQVIRDVTMILDEFETVEI
jgi:hypothetical protein